MSHTPPGSLVEIQLDPHSRWLQVCDRPGATAAASPVRPLPTLGLGLGHRVIAKVAAVHGADFAAAPPPAGFKSCYRLSFSAPPAAGSSSGPPATAAAP